MSNHINEAKATTIASYNITELLNKKKKKKKKKPFEDGNVIKECLVVSGDLLYNGLKIELKCAMKM
jgi:hypothetical protein